MAFNLGLVPPLAAFGILERLQGKRELYVVIGPENRGTMQKNNEIYRSRVCGPLYALYAYKGDTKILKVLNRYYVNELTASEKLKYTLI